MKAAAFVLLCLALCALPACGPPRVVVLAVTSEPARTDRPPDTWRTTCDLLATLGTAAAGVIEPFTIIVPVIGSVGTTSLQVAGDARFRGTRTTIPLPRNGSAVVTLRIGPDSSITATVRPLTEP